MAWLPRGSGTVCAVPAPAPGDTPSAAGRGHSETRDPRPAGPSARQAGGHPLPGPGLAAVAGAGPSGVASFPGLAVAGKRPRSGSGVLTRRRGYTERTATERTGLWRAQSRGRHESEACAPRYRLGRPDAGGGSGTRAAGPTVPLPLPAVFEQYQKARTQFVQTVAELATRPKNIETLQNAGELSPSPPRPDLRGCTRTTWRPAPPRPAPRALSAPRVPRPPRRHPCARPVAVRVPGPASTLS